ncbi:single-stranded DNA-binding protein [Geminicoccaceae bacterium 1502E]|nr:single-stranded DNA-binding protein [Geminicoccaceae bacterium 1502E]
MAGSVNKVILVGNLGRDPEVRFTQNNQKIVHLSVATSDRWRDRQSGENRERTEWHRVVIFNENLADVAERFLSKGRTVYLEGSLQTRKWTDQQGAEKYTTEIVLQRFRGELVLLGGGRGEGGGDDYAGGGDDYGAPAPRGAGGGPRGGGMGGGGGGRGPSGPAGGGARPGPLNDELDDDIPF